MVFVTDFNVTADSKMLESTKQEINNAICPFGRKWTIAEESMEKNSLLPFPLLTCLDDITIDRSQQLKPNGIMNGA